MVERMMFGATFYIIETDTGSSITCYDCGRRSHDPNDVQRRYCAHCDRFHDAEDDYPVYEFKRGRSMLTTIDATRQTASLLKTLAGNQGYTIIFCRTAPDSVRYSVTAVRELTNERLEAKEINETSLVELMMRAIDCGQCFEIELPLAPLTLSTETPETILRANSSNADESQPSSGDASDDSPSNESSPGQFT
jgi:hypothetical protein